MVRDKREGIGVTLVMEELAVILVPRKWHSGRLWVRKSFAHPHDVAPAPLVSDVSHHVL